MYTFDDDQTEEFLVLMKKWKISTDRTGMTSTSGQITYLCMLLHVENLK